MKVYNHKDAYIHLQFVLKAKKQDCFIAVIDETVVHYGLDTNFNRNKALEYGIPMYDIKRKGGAIVASPGDVVYCFSLKENKPALNNKLRRFLANKLSLMNIPVEIVGNDLLVDNKKCFGFMGNKVNDMYFIGGHISIDCNLPLIEQICIKPIEKTPGGLGVYGVTTKDVVEWLQEFWLYNK